MKRLLVLALCMCGLLWGLCVVAGAEGESTDPGEDTTAVTEETTGSTTETTGSTDGPTGDQLGALRVYLSVEGAQVTVSVSATLDGAAYPLPDSGLELSLTVDDSKSVWDVPPTGEIVAVVNNPSRIRAEVVDNFIDGIKFRGDAADWSSPVATTGATTGGTAATTRATTRTTSGTTRTQDSQTTTAGATGAVTTAPLPTTSVTATPATQGTEKEPVSWVGIGLIALAVLLVLGAGAVLFFLVIWSPRVEEDEDGDSDGEAPEGDLDGGEDVGADGEEDTGAETASPDEAPGGSQVEPVTGPEPEAEEARQEAQASPERQEARRGGAGLSPKVDAILADLEAERAAKESGVSLDDLVR